MIGKTHKIDEATIPHSTLIDKVSKLEEAVSKLELA
jgi:hypothetical protein